MAIKFTCPQCGAHFNLSDDLAGKKGKCRKCGRQIKIPLPRPRAASVAATGRFRLADITMASQQMAAVGAPGKGGSPRLVLPSQVALAAVSHQSIRIHVREQLTKDSGPYRIAPGQLKTAPAPRQSKPPGFARRVYNIQTNGVLRLLRQLNDFAYLVSMPFLLMIFVAILFKRRDVALIGAAGVILPNIGRFFINGFTMVVLPFKDGPIQGVLFFIPPFTFYYLYKRWRRMKKATLRFLSPAIPIVCVVATFILIPFLRSGDVPEGAALKDRIQTEVDSLQKDIEGQVDDLKQRADELSQDERVRDVTGRVRKGFESVKQSASEQLDQLNKDDPTESTDPE